jgi:tRNA threonylcarbamoyladenosine biosynthesis protein TsaB
MLTLAIECSSRVASVTLTDHASFNLTRRSNNPKSHTEFLNQAIHELTEAEQAPLQNIDRICTSTGPGSFTGIRVGLSLAKTLSYSLKKPLIAIDSLTLLFVSYTAPKKFPFVTVTNAQKNHVFYSVFYHEPKDCEFPRPQCIPASKFWSDNPGLEDEAQVIGDGIGLIKPFINKLGSNLDLIETPLYPDSEALSQIGVQWAKSIQPIDWKMIQPLYIRASEAEENLRINSR